jgi:hypothetical protein
MSAASSSTKKQQLLQRFLNVEPHLKQSISDLGTYIESDPEASEEALIKFRQLVKLHERVLNAIEKLQKDLTEKEVDELANALGGLGLSGGYFQKRKYKQRKSKKQTKKRIQKTRKTNRK